MTTTLKPRQVDENAPKRWVKEGFGVFKRTYMVLLPLSLLVGLGVGYLLFTNLLVFAPFVVGLSGLWQALMLHVSEEAAKGKRVTIQTAFEGLLLFAQAPNNVMKRQIMVRFLVSGAVCWSFLLLVIFFGGEAKPERVRTLFEIFSLMSDRWLTFFIWVWAFQRCGIFSFLNPLVRRFGMEWDMATALTIQGQQTNQHCRSKVTFVFFLPVFTIVFAPYLIFFFDIFWSGFITVAYRDIFEHENGS